MKKPFDLALHTDLYQLTMAYCYFKKNVVNKQAVFHHFFRRKPFGGEYAVAAGLEDLIHFVRDFEFNASDLDYLRSLMGIDDKPLFDEPFLKYLKDFKFELDIDAVPEGTVVFPYEPMIRVKGSILQAQLLESALLNIVNFQTLIATKASRICSAAEGQEVIEFGLRRAQGINGAFSASRAAIVGGCQSTSNVLVGKYFNVPVKGTHAHSWVMSYPGEEESFRAYADCMPGNCVFLVDTYDTLQGVKRAIEVSKKRKDQLKFLGIRIDSGDLAMLSSEARKLLDQAGFHKTKIMATNELDEFIIRDLKHQGAKIDLWGVGTALASAKGQSALDGVYKLAAYTDENECWHHALKISEQLVKVTNPGILNVRRFYTPEGNVGDMIYDELSPIDEQPTLIDPFDPTKRKKIIGSVTYRDLLIPIFRKGACIYQSPNLLKMQENTKNEMAQFHPTVMRFLYPSPYFVGLEKNLFNKKIELIEQMKGTL